MVAADIVKAAPAANVLNYVFAIVDQAVILLTSDHQDGSLLFVYDDCSSITSIINSALFVNDSIRSIDPIEVRTQGGVNKHIDMKGTTYGFGEVFFSPKQFINIICAYDMEHRDDVCVTPVYDTKGRRSGYDIFFLNV